MNFTNVTEPFTLTPRWVVFLSRTSTDIGLDTCIFLFLGMAAFTGNLLVLLSFYCNPSLRNCTTYLVVSLATTDILYSVTVLPLSIFWLNYIKTRQFELEIGIERFQILCEFQALCCLTLTSVSGYMMALMSLNRFTIFCRPACYTSIFTKRNTIMMIVVVWLLCFSIAIYLVKGDFFFAKFTPQELICFLSRRTRTQETRIISHLVLGIAIATPYVIILYCYINILLRIYIHKRGVGAVTWTNSNLLNLHEIKITRMLFSVLLGYLVTWIPVLVVGVVNSYNQWLSHRITVIVPFSIASSSVLNPLIYGAMDSVFRREYSKIVKCKY